MITQEEYSKLSKEEKFKLAVNAFKATCDVLFETDTQYDIEIGGVDLKHLAEMANGKDDRLNRNENPLCGVWHTIKIGESNSAQLHVTTFKYST